MFGKTSRTPYEAALAQAFELASNNQARLTSVGVIGNTAETILGRLSCSVLTIKPEGFVSPVTL